MQSPEGLENTPLINSTINNFEYNGKPSLNMQKILFLFYHTYFYSTLKLAKVTDQVKEVLSFTLIFVLMFW
jgi:hypothetical protein